MTRITIEQAEKQLAALIKRARAGEEIIISDGPEPDVKLAPVEASYRGRGILKGKVKVSDQELFAPLSENELKRWWGEDK